MKKFFQTTILALAAVLMLPTVAQAYEQIAEGVYSDGNGTVCICDGVTTLAGLNLNPATIYCYAPVPPVCDAATFTGYSAALHVPGSSLGAYFIADYWYNFSSITGDAVAPTGVTVSESDAELYPAEQLQLSATVSPGNAMPRAVAWYSTDPSVATVTSSGKVTAVAMGDCDIVAVCVDKQAVCHVSVLLPTSLVLEPSSVTLEQTQQVTLTATVTPSMPAGAVINWNSTNPAVATVSNGTVTAVGVGTCYITAEYSGVSAACRVTVVEARVRITLDTHEARLLPNHMLTLTPSMSPWSTDLSVTSTSPSVAVARLVNGTVQVVGMSEGTSSIIVGSVDGTAIADTCVVTVYTERGDVNCDGYVDPADISALINYLLNGTAVNTRNADTNNNGNVGPDDISMLINYLLGSVPTLNGENFTVNGVSFTMIPVEGGTFTMGATEEQGSDAYDWEYPVHQVTLSDYSIGQTEVTQELWVAVMGNNPSYHNDNLQRPVEKVSWNDCQEFIAELNRLTGKHFRLPSEAEWEFAARGGNLSQHYKYSGSNDIGEVAWYYDNSYAVGSSNPDYGTHPVGKKKANELGLYDMSGNVWEWCQDWYGDYSSAAQTNPTGPETGSDRVLRGGSWSSFAGSCRVSYRFNDSPSFRDYSYGLRLAL